MILKYFIVIRYHSIKPGATITKERMIFKGTRIITRSKSSRGRGIIYIFIKSKTGIPTEIRRIINITTPLMLGKKYSITMIGITKMIPIMMRIVMFKFPIVCCIISVIIIAKNPQIMDIM